MKIILGTAQFGISYGTFNKTGQVPQEKVEAMLSRAEATGINMLDTARAYGTSEVVLARAGAPSRFNVVTKCPDLRAESDPVTALYSAFDASCAALGVTHLYGYLMHNAEDLARPGIWDALSALRDVGRVVRIGVSGYSATDVINLLDRFPLTLVQLPANVLDPWYECMTMPKSVEVHARSAFLQGFLLSDPEQLPPHLLPFRAVLEQFRSQAAEQGMTPLEAALAPLLSSQCLNRVTVGVDSLEQLEQILQAVQVLDLRPKPQLGPFNGVTRDLIDPRRWRTQ